MAITSMNIALNQALLDFVAADMRENGYASISEYLRALVRERRRQRDEDRLLVLANEVRSQKAPPKPARKRAGKALQRKKKS